MFQLGYSLKKDMSIPYYKILSMKRNCQKMQSIIISALKKKIFKQSSSELERDFVAPAKIRDDKNSTDPKNSNQSLMLTVTAPLLENPKFRL